MNAAKLYKTILIPLDGTEFAEAALRHATAIAKSFNSHCHLVRVLPLAAYLQPGLGYMAAVPFHAPVIVPDAAETPSDVKEAAGHLEMLKQKLLEEGVTCSYSVRRGNLASLVIDEAEKIQADLIVKSSRQLKGLSKWLAGSWSQTICQEASCPVLLIQGNCAQDPLHEHSIYKDLVSKLADHHISLAEAARCELKLVQRAVPEGIAMILAALGSRREIGPDLKQIFDQLRFYEGGIQDIGAYLDQGHSGPDIGLVSHIFQAKGAEAAALLADEVDGLSPQQALDILGFLTPIIMSDLVRRSHRSSELRAILSEEVELAEGETAEWMTLARELVAR